MIEDHSRNDTVSIDPGRTILLVLIKVNVTYLNLTKLFVILYDRQCATKT